MDAQHPYQFGSVTNLLAAGSGATPKPIALTFDDGPSDYSEQIIDILRDQHVPATFFVIGNQIEGRSSVVKDELSAGNRVGSHTWSHRDLTKLTPAEITSQIDQTEAVLKPLLGGDPTRCVRPPYDATNTTVTATLAKSGMASALYDVDPRDWEKPGAGTIATRVVGAAHPGANVDLHDGGGDRSQTVAALPTIIQGLRERGYTFVSIC